MPPCSSSSGWKPRPSRTPGCQSECFAPVSVWYCPPGMARRPPRTVMVASPLAGTPAKAGAVARSTQAALRRRILPPGGEARVTYRPARARGISRPRVSGAKVARAPETGFYFEPLSERLVLVVEGAPFPTDDHWAYVGDPIEMSPEVARIECANRWPGVDPVSLELELDLDYDRAVAEAELRQAEEAAGLVRR